MSGPRLTVALITPDNFGTIRLTTSHVAAQSTSAEIELLILSPHAASVRADPGLSARFHSVRVVATDLSAGSGVARAAAVREAAAPIIVFSEDHCFPQAGWADAIVRAHDADWAAVGPVVTNANPESTVSWADLLMGYGPWLAPGKSGEREHLPGHNSSYKTSALLGLGDDLAELIEAETALQWRLREGGARLYQESAAQVAHTNFDRWSTWILVSFSAGRVFAATRSRSWTRARRLAFAGASPLVPLVRLWRHVRQGFAAGLPVSLIARVAPVLAAGLIVDAAGQAVGCVAGAGRARISLVEWDFHRNVPRD